MIDFIIGIGSAVMQPLYYAVSWIMVTFHSAFEAVGLDPASGVTWSLSIIGLVVVIRTLLIPLFVKQIKAQRGLQMLQPEIKKIQERHKHDRERQSREMMALYKRTGTNPLSSCFPILAQAPIFFALFGVLNGIPQGHEKGVLTGDLVQQAAAAEVFGAKIFDTFLQPDNTAAQIVAFVLIVLMSATTFITQKQLMTKNMPASAMTGPFAQQQKILLYVFPAVFAVTGVNFPIGVLLYWFTTNLWTMGQQLYVIRRMPSPGSPAYESYQRRHQGRSGRRWRLWGPRRAEGEDGDDAGEPAGGATRLDLAGDRSGPGGAARTSSRTVQAAGTGQRSERTVRPQPSRPEGAPSAQTAATARRASGQRQQPRRQPRSKRR